MDLLILAMIFELLPCVIAPCHFDETVDKFGIERSIVPLLEKEMID
jgi:hypothetical protein